MRRNVFGEYYCHTAEEVRARIDEHGASVYVPSVSPPDDSGLGSAEIADSETGEVVCYVEAASPEAITSILAELGLEPDA